MILYQPANNNRSRKSRNSHNDFRKWLPSLDIMYGDRRNGKPMPRKSSAALSHSSYGSRLSNYKLDDHFAGVDTYYYMGPVADVGGCVQAKCCTLLIDVDVMKSGKLGTKQGAEDFVAFLKKWFPTAHYEISTNGNGQHGFLKVTIPADTKTENFKEVITELEDCLLLLQAFCNADIEKVELMGKPLLRQTTYSRHRYISSRKFTYPQCLAKLPRDESGFLESESITLDDLKAICAKIRQHSNTKQTTKKLADIKLRAGSRDFLANLDVEKVYEYVKPLGEVTSSSKGDALNTTYTFGKQHIAWMAIVFWLVTKANEKSDSKSCGQRRCEGLWHWLEAQGHDMPAWNNYAWTSVRNFLGDHGMLQWFDENYTPSKGDNSGKCIEFVLCNQMMEGLGQIIGSDTPPITYGTKLSIIDLIQDDVPIIRPVLRFGTYSIDEKFYSYDMEELLKHAA